MDILFEKYGKYALMAVSLITAWGAFVYKIFNLGALGILTVLILSALTFFIVIYKLNNYNPEIINLRKFANVKDIFRKNNFTDYLASSGYLFFWCAAFYALIANASSSALVSPWQKTPFYFFLLYFFASLYLSFLILKKKPLSGILIACHFFLSFSIAAIIYKIGYGHDPFIHRATEELINRNGTVEPKPLYYLGQYALVVIVHKLFFIPIALLDKFLVPLFAALALPAALLSILPKWLENKTIARFTVLIALILPFPFFIVTTPQNLAYVFFLTALIYGLNCKNQLDLGNIVLLALASFAVHPLAGIPALLFVLLLAIYHSDNPKYKNKLYRISYLLMAAALPFAFLFIQKTGTNSPDIRQTEERSEFAWLNVEIPDQDNIFLNFLYLLIFNFKIIYALAVFAGFIIIMKYKKECRLLFLYLFSALAFFISYFLSTRLSFAFLIDYEQSDYSERILNIAAFFLLPLFILAIYAFLTKLFKEKMSIKYAFVFFFNVCLCVSLYGSYPRLDNYWNSRGYSVGQNEIETVRWIDNDAKEEYIVLANQQVSAAALQEFGFAKYYKNETAGAEDIFYYPIPTGGALYQHYLDMVYEKPSRQTMESAMNLAGVNKAYFVLNKYWWAFSKIQAEAKMESDSWKEIGQGDIYIFKYSKTK